MPNTGISVSREGLDGIDSVIARCRVAGPLEEDAIGFIFQYVFVEVFAGTTVRRQPRSTSMRRNVALGAEIIGDHVERRLALFSLPAGHLKSVQLPCVSCMLQWSSLLSPGPCHFRPGKAFAFSAPAQHQRLSPAMMQPFCAPFSLFSETR